MIMTFKDLIFYTRETGFGTIGARHEFKNGYSISVIAGPGTYSSPTKAFESPADYEKFEVAIFSRPGEFITDRLFDCGDVAGWITRDQINEVISKIEKL